MGLYGTLGYGRSLSKVARKLGKSTNLMSRWSVRWSWRLRVKEWDQDQETIKAVALNSSIVEMAERQAAQATQAVAGLMLPHMALAKAIRRLSAPRVVLAPAAR